MQEVGPLTDAQGRTDRELDIDAAWEFFDRCGVTATPDAVEQLVDAFLPALKIIARRGYDRNGASWKAQGWRGQLFEAMKRLRRLEFMWSHRKMLHEDSVPDAINYCGFLYRAYHDDPGNVWGEFGEPDKEDE